MTQAAERIRRSPRGPRSLPKVGAVCVNAHVRICAGGAGQPASLPRNRCRNETQGDVGQLVVQGAADAESQRAGSAGEWGRLDGAIGTAWSNARDRKHGVGGVAGGDFRGYPELDTTCPAMGSCSLRSVAHWLATWSWPATRVLSLSANWLDVMRSQLACLHVCRIT